jgi:hypothetical protein
LPGRAHQTFQERYQVSDVAASMKEGEARAQSADIPNQTTDRFAN